MLNYSFSGLWLFCPIILILSFLKLISTVHLSPSLLHSLSPSYQGGYHSCGVHYLPQRELVFALPSAAGHRYHLLPQTSAHRLTAGKHKPTLNQSY